MALCVSRLLWVCVFLVVCVVVLSETDSSDVEAIRALKDQWRNTPPSWKRSNDPCSWEGVTCSDTRIVSLGLSSMGLVGQLVGDIAGLTALTSLDLSFNGGLTGSISPRIGDLKSLNILILAGCSFTGNIPPELGNLHELSFLALNTNNLTGEIPSSLGSLSKLYWLDIAENHITGSIPVSSDTKPGLDQLKHAKHFHFNKNRLSGGIPEQLFSGDMVLIHVLFDGNQLTGEIPSTIGYVQTLEVLRLDRNALSGEVPLNLNNLTSLSELNLAHNNLLGALPDLNGMNTLSYVDLSNNSFHRSDPPIWLSTLPSLSTLVMEFGSLKGRLPQELFSLSGIQQVKLKNNELNDTLNMGSSVGEQLQLVDLQSNEIEAVTLSSEYKNTLELSGNPVCDTALAHTTYCQVQQQTSKAYSTSLANCGSKSCPSDKKLSPQTCDCAYPYEGTLYFRAPSFRELSSVNIWHSLEMSLWVKLGLTPGSVSLQNPFFNTDDYLQVYLQLFPGKGAHFNRSEVQKMGFYLSNQTYKPPKGFGPYFFIASPYDFAGGHRGASIGIGTIIGIATGSTFVVITLIGLLLYAVRQKKRAEKAIGLSRPFASWASTGKDGGGAPQLKGARWFSYDELKKSTHNFSHTNLIGSGGYGKVYKGTVLGGQVVAIKRAQQASMQGGHEFKTEIELLSRVHHKNLVGLVGFCFEQGEQMLVYEFMPNGTLRDSLTGKSGMYLDWKRRLRIALGSARGLAYLHELADPPIIHRDIKSTNILLDENLTAKVADFGLSKLISDSEAHVSTQVKGTMGYLDPEYYMTQQLTEKSDVYSFGVVMLELVTARPPIQKGKYIVREVKLTMDKSDEDEYGLRALMDPIIKSMTYLTGFRRFIQLAMQCVEDCATDRPTMSDVVKALENILISDGLHTDSTSASSSATEFGSVISAPKHPYSEATLKRNDSYGFDYSGGYNISAKVEPKLSGNPVCDTALAHTTYCQVQQQTSKAYSTSLANCGNKSCPSDKKLSPQTCDCAYPYEGTLYFRAPSFRELSSVNIWHSLEMSLWVKLGLTPGSVSLQNPFFNTDDYLQVYLQLFPGKGAHFNRSEVQKMGFYLSNQTYKPPKGFGPYFFIASPYDFAGGHRGASIGIGTIIGIATGSTFVVITLIGLLLYAVRQKKRAEKAIGLSRPFASWASTGKDGGGAPQLKGARWFSYDELKKSTHNFSHTNLIGSGGYGKVYKGTVLGGQVVAIKRAQQASMQGGHEFKTEIELLSRVHHKNLVGLVGFCFEQGEQMLVYEFMPNGTLRDSLTGKSGMYLDWKRRLRIALGSARGLAYLHELADPPIIHRDIKSTNILLDENLTAKVADFGLSKLISDSEAHVSTQVKGTMGYLDPEYYMTQQLTEKSDVYSFGVVMLELVTARPPIQKGKYIVREVKLTMDKSDEDEYGLRALMDPIIKSMTYLTGFRRFIQLAMQCVEDCATDRPTMSDVVKALENILISDGLHTDSTSASSSATEFGSVISAPKHPYSEATLKRNDSYGFDYSGGYNISANVEPK